MSANPNCPWCARCGVWRCRAACGGSGCGGCLCGLSTSRTPPFPATRTALLLLATTSLHSAVQRTRMGEPSVHSSGASLASWSSTTQAETYKRRCAAPQVVSQATSSRGGGSSSSSGSDSSSEFDGVAASGLSAPWGAPGPSDLPTRWRSSAPRLPWGCTAARLPTRDATTR